MYYKAIFKILGIVLILFSVGMLPPVVIDFIYHEGAGRPFLASFLLSCGAGFILWQLCRKTYGDLYGREGFLIVVLIWTVLSLFGAMPFVFSEHVTLNFTDCLFESVSGLTTTGASVIPHLGALSHAMRFYHQELEFLGGMGIVVLTIAVLPMLGVGGMQLFRAEMPGPMKNAKLTPRITETAKALWYIYVGLTVIGIFAFIAAGMTPFDAIGESFAAVSTGGFSMHENGFAYYNSTKIELICVGLMWLGGTNFSLHFIALQQKKLKHFWADSEFKVLLGLHLAFVLVTTVILLKHQIYAHVSDAFVQSLFNIVSLGTTTGFVSAPFSTWPTFIPYMIMVLGIIGGCSGSTSGGIKIIRMLLLQKQTGLEIKRLLHPNAVFTIKFGKQILPTNILESMWAFIAVFFTAAVLLLMALMATGLDFTTAFGALTASLANAGAGIGAVAQGYAHIPLMAKWLLIVGMLMGRLELFTILVLFSRNFWRD